jgi:multidrug efflux pump subunit AcrB
MRFSRFFIDRPIFAAVLAVLITVVGALAFLACPSRNIPKWCRPR